MPCDIIQYFEAFLLESGSHRVDIVKRSANPYGSVGLEYTPAQTNPISVKLMLFLKRINVIPLAFIYAYCLSAAAGNAAIGKKVWRICKNHIDAFGLHFFQSLKCVRKEKCGIIIFVIWFYPLNIYAHISSLL